MINTKSRCWRTILALCLAFFCGLAAATGAIASGAAKKSASLKGLAPDEVNTVLASLSDEQVRSLLIEELKKDPALTAASGKRQQGFVGLVASLLRLLDGEGEVDLGAFLNQELQLARSLPSEMDWLLRRFSLDGSRGGAWRNFGLLVLVLAGGLLVEYLFRLLTTSIRKQFMEPGMSDLSGIMRFWASVLRVLPLIIHIAVFTGSAILIFVCTPLEEVQELRHLFLALLVSLTGIRLMAVLSQFFFAPYFPEVRLVPVSDRAAGSIHKTIVFLFGYTLLAVCFIALSKDAGLQVESIILISMLLATALLIFVALLVLASRKQVAEVILAEGEADGGGGSLLRIFAAIWHVLVLGYLLVVWFFMIFQLMRGPTGGKGAFLFSLLLLPMYVVLDRLSLWIVRSVVHTMRIYDPATLPDDDNLPTALAAMENNKNSLVRRTQGVVRVLILITLAAWLLKMWGYPLPYAAAVGRAVFDSLLTLTLALLFWRLASGYIERKIQEAVPHEAENSEEDDEWGAAADRGRSYTLLPMVRKFIGTTLVVMVTLIILSSMGVDIGPLLAGAGVVGLAIGFGAQKLVADVFSGFFYLLDDAFRVGEYLEAGKVSGAVEAITLRNVMLRHHRGMLQIVPYSELGSITNFMRGGIVVKFNLEFPYDTDIDKVRKIIKKVGQTMLKDPEFGEDFIRPVKSQGVREITSSVMVIRVKFTAKPGTHFVIRREAYRRITEALAAQGIHYAHRKVIVELPQEAYGRAAEQPEQVKEAAAGAAMAALEAEEKKGAAAADK